MPIDVQGFKGEAPRIAPHLLPIQFGQNSENARLLSGNIESWNGFLNSTAQVITSQPVTIYYLDDQVWLSWNQPTIVSTVPGGAQQVF